MARIVGTQYYDWIVGRAGADQIYGLDGSDYIYAGSGNDTVYGGAGDDEVHLENGNDIFSGGSGDDYALGGEGRDLMRGDSGADLLYGDAGRDTLVGGAGDDALYGGSDADTLTGDTGDDYMRGGSGIDVCDGGSGDDYVSFYNFDATQAAVVDLRIQTVLNDGFGYKETLISVEGLGAGTVFADTFYGTDGDNQLQASLSDTVYGFGGDDIVYVAGVRGATIDGGDGEDTIQFTSQYAKVDGEGAVTFESAARGVTFDLTDGTVVDDGFGNAGKVIGFENATGNLYGDHLTGSAGDNVLDGGQGNDVLFGGDGADTITGGQGSDLANGGGGADVFHWDYLFENLGDWYPVAQDVVQDFADGEDKLEILDGGQGLTFMGTGDFTGSGQIRYEVVDGDTYIYTSAVSPWNYYANLSIKLIGEHQLTADDFVNLGSEDAHRLGMHAAFLGNATGGLHLAATPDLVLA